MADNPIDQLLEEDGIIEQQEEALEEPLYRVLGSEKIPVSKKMGHVWKGRKDQAVQARQNTQSCWDEAIRYYEHDQMSHRKARDNSSGNAVFAGRLNQEWTETENVIFSNAAIMVPMIYSKNPNVEFTYESDTLAPRAEMCERLANKLMFMKDPPGINLKPKMRRVILSTLLTNAGYLKVDWTNKQDSTEVAVRQLAELGKQYTEAKTAQEVKEYEAKIEALEERVAMLSPSGPSVSFKLPHQIVVDPNSMEPDHCDAGWIMEWDMVKTTYLAAVYGTDDGKSIYEPTHVLIAKERAGSSDSVEEEVNNFNLFVEKKSALPSAYGFQDASQLEDASYTKVWYVWDKATRRVYLFCDNNWKWPVWVWDDPLRLPRFFPFFRCWFHESIVQAVGKGEVTYILDQQDAINEMNDESRRARHWIRRNIFYDKEAISQEDVEAVLKGPDGTARGVKLAEGMTLDKAIMSLTPPALKFPELFNIDNKLQAINRVVGVNDAMRGAQYRTNTTNAAIAEYKQGIEIRVSEKTDLVEDFVAEVMWNVIILCMMNWEEEDVLPLVGQKYQGIWQRVTDPREFTSLFSPRVESGSMEKPNSAGKQEEAIKVGQVMGQFAGAAPGIILPLIKMFSKTFPDAQFTDEEMDFIMQTIQMGLTKAGAGPGGEEQGPSDDEMRAEITQRVQSLPPEAKQKLQQLVQQGVPPAEAFQQVSGQ